MSDVDKKLKILKQEWIKNLVINERLKKNLTQTDFGKLLGLSRSSIYFIEANGLSHDLKIYQLLEKLGYEPNIKLKELMNLN